MERILFRSWREWIPHHHMHCRPKAWKGEASGHVFVIPGAPPNVSLKTFTHAVALTFGMQGLLAEVLSMPLG